MKKSLSIVLAASVIASSFAFGAVADDMIDDITAKLCRDVTVSVDGAAQLLSDASGNTLYPISYNGITYLPASSVASMIGATLSEDVATGSLSYTTIVSAPEGSTMTQARINALRGIAVFWAPTGNKIHSSPECRTFKMGITYAGTYEQAVSVRTDGWCGVCGHFEDTNKYAVDYFLDDCYTYEDFLAMIPASAYVTN